MPWSLRHVRTSFFGSSALGGGGPGDIVHESAGCRVVAPVPPDRGRRQGNPCDLVPPDAALALSLVGRARELIFGIPGIVVWRARSAAAPGVRRRAAVAEVE